jgi:exonuclease VII large subunit
MMQTESGEVVRSVKQLNTGDTVQITLNDGRIRAAVTDIKENAL